MIIDRMADYVIMKLLKWKGEIEMMALLLAQRVILGKLEFKDVPASLKPQVYEHLVDSGVEFLAGDYVPGE